MSEKQKFQTIISNIRSELKYLQSVQEKMYFTLIDIEADIFVSRQLAVDTKEWIIDVYLDKFFETNAKIKKFLLDIELQRNETLEDEGIKFMENLERVALNLNYLMLPRRDKKEIKTAQKMRESFYGWVRQVEISLYLYSKGFDRTIITASNYLNQTDWSKMKNINFEDYILATRRKKYVSAREELERAKQASKTGQWDEILNHLRPAIDFSLKERFRFKDMRHMKTFLVEAEEFGLLPAYEMLYLFFDEGSKRLHKGKVHTPLDCQTAVEYVAKFIDYLDFAEIPEGKIEEFRQKCNCVD